jgi:hypothetical protein
MVSIGLFIEDLKLCLKELTKADGNTEYSRGICHALHPESHLRTMVGKRNTLIKELSPATRYEDPLAGQEGCFVRGEKNGNSGDVIRLAESAKGGHSYRYLAHPPILVCG